MSTDARRFTSLWMMQAVPRPAAVVVEAVVEEAAVAVAVLVVFLPLRERELRPQRPDVGLCPLHPRLLEAVEAQVRVVAEEAAVAVAAALKPLLLAAVAHRFPVWRSLTCCWLPVLM
jgi:hypothetical protein